MKIVFMLGDITKQSVDAIVNSANNHLLGGGGVDGAIHRQAGRELYDACKEIGFCATGQAVWTYGYHLPARYVIHTVGPRWGREQGKERELLADCYKSVFELATILKIGSIAFPSISTGAFGYPISEASEIAIQNIREHFHLVRNKLEDVRFVLYNKADFNVYEQTRVQILGKESI